MIHLRPFTREDCEAVVVIRNACESEPVTAAQFRRWIEVDDSLQAPGGACCRLVAMDGACAVVGFGQTGRDPETPAGLFGIRVIVDPAVREVGIGSLLYATLELEARRLGATRLESRTHGADDASYAWAQRRGFYMDRQRTESVLDLRSWDGSRFAGHVERLTAAGFTLVNKCGQLEEPLRRGLYEVEAATVHDVPNFQGEMLTFERWDKAWTGNDAPRVVSLALDGQQVVGASTLYLPTAPGAGAETDYTGVLSQYRGRGIALALKLLSIDAAIAAGAPRMRTWNDLDNPAMLAVNVKLGYQFIPGPRRLKKELA